MLCFSYGLLDGQIRRMLCSVFSCNRYVIVSILTRMTTLNTCTTQQCLCDKVGMQIIAQATYDPVTYVIT